MPALNFWKFQKGINLAPQSGAPSSPTNGDLYYDSVANRFKGRINAATDIIAGLDTADTFTNKTISGSSNTLSNIADASLAVSYFKADGSRSLTGALVQTQQATPANPASGSNKLYFKSDNILYTLTSAGTEAALTAGAVSGPGSSTNTALAVWNGTSGSALSNSSILLSGANALSQLRTVASDTTLTFQTNGSTTAGSVSTGQNWTLGATSSNSHVFNGLINVGAAGDTAHTSVFNGRIESNLNATAGVGISNFVRVINGDNTNSASNSFMRLQVGGTSAGSPKFSYQIGSAGNEWITGVDQAATQAFKISFGSAANAGFGTNDYLSITTGGLSTFGGDLSVSRSASGAQVLTTIENTSNTASATARLKISVAGATAGDPAIDWNISGATDWAMGPSNANSDDFYLGQGTSVTSNTVFKVSKTNLDVTIGGNQAFQVDATNATPVKYSRSASGVNQRWSNSNTSNTASSDSGFSFDTAGSSGGNPYVLFTIQSAQNYTIGIDNAASNDPFKISRSTVLGSSDAIIVDSDGNKTSVVAMDLAITTAGRGLQVKEGSNAKMGVSTLSAGTVTVSTTAVTTNSRIFLTVQSLGTVAVATPVAVTARTNGTSFVITSSSVTDTSVIAWMLVEPA